MTKSVINRISMINCGLVRSSDEMGKMPLFLGIFVLISKQEFYGNIRWSNLQLINCCSRYRSRYLL